MCKSRTSYIWKFFILNQTCIYSFIVMNCIGRRCDICIIPFMLNFSDSFFSFDIGSSFILSICIKIISYCPFFLISKYYSNHNIYSVLFSLNIIISLNILFVSKTLTLLAFFNKLCITNYKRFYFLGKEDSLYE